MGGEKERRIEAEDNWREKAKAENLRCGMCGSLIEYDDRDIYFMTRNCSWCEHILNKDD